MSTETDLPPPWKEFGTTANGGRVWSAPVGTPPPWVDERPNPKVIDGEVVDAPRVLSDKPATAQALRCDTHPEWLDCGLDRPDCVPFIAATEPVDGPHRFRDRRRLSYPRLRAGEVDGHG